MRECEVCAVCASGITLKQGKEECFVDFQACAANAPIQKGGNCVALRNAATLEFAFFTVPPTIVCFRRAAGKSALAARMAQSALRICRPKSKNMDIPPQNSHNSVAASKSRRHTRLCQGIFPCRAAISPFPKAGGKAAFRTGQMPAWSVRRP